MSRLRPFRARVGVAGAASLAALSLLVTSLTPLAMRASAADESAQSPDVATSQEAATASSESEAATAPAAEAGAEAPAADTDTAGADAADAGAEAPAAEVAPEDQPRTRRARSTSAKPATLAMTVTNDSPTLAIRDKQITTINYACSSVTTPCEGASIEVLLPAPVTPAGTALTDKLYTAVAVTGSTVLRTEQTTVAGNPRMKRLLFPLQRSIPAGTSDRIQITWTYDGNDAPNNSTTTQQVNFTALNADSLEDSQTTKWTADTDIAIEKSGPTNPNSYPAVGGETTYKLRYGYQQIDQTNPNKVGIRWNGSSQKNGVNATGFVQVQDIKVVDPLPAQAEFVSATNGGVYDAGTHTVTWSYDKWAWQNPIESLVTVKYPEGSVTTADTVSNKATITAAVQNDPTTILTKSSEITHGFAVRKPAGRVSKVGNDWQYQVRKGLTQWRLGAANTGNTTTHVHFDDTLPCTWSTQDAQAAGASCDQPTMVSPYRFNIFSKSGYEDKGGWTFEYWTNKGQCHRV